MNCGQANLLDLVSYLATNGLKPARERGNNIWYHSPLHDDNTPSFKVNRVKNTWYDFGIGRGGRLVDLVCLIHSCDISAALRKIESKQTAGLPSFSHQKSQLVAEESGIKILRVHDYITDIVLRRYLNQRNIPKDIAEKFCKEIIYQIKEIRFRAIGFKNNAGGYELRSPNFKGSSSPKFTTYFDKAAKQVAVFEGFFDFLTYQSIHQGQTQPPTNFLVLNSLSFINSSLLLLENQDKIHLYLDNDAAGRKCVQQLMERSENIVDESALYKDYKDLNEWLVGFGKQQGKQTGHRHSL